MNLGVIHGEPSAIYHATNGVSSHRLQDFAAPNVPLLYHRKYIAKAAAPDEPSAAPLFGEYLHTLALEGEAVADARFVVSPSFDRRTKQGKIDAENFTILNAGKTPISSTDKDLAWRMVDAIRAKPTAVELLSHGKPEVVFRHQMSSFTIQSRIDWFDERMDEHGRPLILDVKSIDRLANFDRQFFKYHYARQAAFYQLVVYETLKLAGAWPRFLFIVVEKEEPFQCELREPDAAALDLARDAVMKDLTRLKECYDTGKWPGTGDEIRPVSLPEWALARGEA